MGNLFFNSPEECLHYYWQNEPETFAVVSAYRERDRLGIAHPPPPGGGSCTSANCCCNGTGCHPLTQNGYCACNGPDGPCVWVPGV